MTMMMTRVMIRGASPGRGRRETGSMTVEVAVLTPVIIVMLLVVVALGRVTHARQLVAEAAAAAARAGTLAAGPAGAAAAGQAAAAADLNRSELSCASSSVVVDAGALRPGGEVSATVACTADLSTLVMAGVPGSMTVSGSATSPVESYRDLGGVVP